MSVTALTAAALLAGVPPAVVLVVALALASPPAALLLGGAFAAFQWSRRRRKPGEIDEADFCSAVASELQAGASLRHSVAAAAAAHASPELGAVARAATGGAPAREVAARLAAALPVNGRQASLAFEVAAETGAGAAAVFGRLASGAARDAELRRERNALTAQARLSAAVVAGAPITVVFLLSLTGNLRLFGGAGAVELAVAASGLGLVIAGLAVVWTLLRRSAR